MRTAYTLLGLLFLLVFGAAVYFLRGAPPEAGAPSLDIQTASSTLHGMKLSSAAFKDEGFIPREYTCDGKGMNPPLSISGVPERAKSLVLIVEDPDVPKEVMDIGVFDHWILFNIPTTTVEIPEDDMAAGTPGMATSGKGEYVPPCPPPEYEPSTHRYIFRLFALDTMLELKANAPKAVLEEAMQGHVIDTAELMGKYQRK